MFKQILTKKNLFFLLSILLLKPNLHPMGSLSDTIEFNDDDTSSSNSIIKTDKQSFDFQEFTNRIFSNYKEYPNKISHKNKNNHVYPNNPPIALHELNEIVDTFIELFCTNNFTNKKSWIQEKNTPTKELIRNNIDNLNYRCPYAQKINIAENAKIFTYGDIHGSIHSLLRNLWRLVINGFLTKNLTIHDPKNCMIFLGDFVDRGRYSVEVLYILIQLKIANPNQVFLLRGNHEDPKMGTAGGLYTIRDEIKTKYSRPANLTDKKLSIAETINKLNCIYDLLPFVLYAKRDKSFMQFCHGGIDPSYNPIKLLTSKDDIYYESLKEKNDITTFLDQETRNNAITHFNEKESMPVGQETDFYAFGLIWGDFGRCVNSKKENIFDNNKIVFSGHGYNISLSVYQNYLTDLNEQLKEKELELVGLVRGHQHTDFGLGLFTNTEITSWTTCISPENLNLSFSLKSVKIPIFTLCSAPEGVGNDNSHRKTTNFNYDSFSILHANTNWKNGTIRPYDYRIEKRDSRGLYCAISQKRFPADIQPSFSTKSFKNPVIINKKHGSRKRKRDKNKDRNFEPTKKLKTSRNKRKRKRKRNTSDDEKTITKKVKRNDSIDFDKKTQSLQHLQFILKSNTSDPTSIIPERVDLKKNTIIKLIEEKYDSTNANKLYVNVVEKCLLKEQNLNDFYYVFYHANENSDNYLLFLIYQELYKLGQNTNILPLRFIVNKSLSSLNDFFQLSNKYKKNIAGKIYEYIDPDTQEGKQTFWFDHIPQITEQLLSVNFSLFGNHEKKFESSFHYLMGSSSSGNSVKMTNILQKTVAELKIPNRYIEKIKSLFKNISSQISSGSMLQIFIKKEDINNVAYLAFAGGKPVNQQILDENWDDIQKKHTSISPFLDQYIKEPMTLNKNLGKCTHNGYSNTYSLSIDKLQGRLWLPAIQLYNPEKTLIYPYFTNNIEDKIKDYKEKLIKIFTEIKNDFLKKAEKTIQQSDMYMATPLRGLYLKQLKKQEKITDKRSQSLINNLDLQAQPSSSMDVQIRNLFLQTIEDNDFDISKQSETITKIENIIKDDLAFKLPYNTTPLIIAIKYQNIHLIKLVLNIIEKYDKKEIIFFEDNQRLKASDWAKELNLNEIFTILSIKELILTESFEDNSYLNQASDIIQLFFNEKILTIFSTKKATSFLNWAKNQIQLMTDTSPIEELCNTILDLDISNDVSNLDKELIAKILEIFDALEIKLKQTNQIVLLNQLKTKNMTILIEQLGNQLLQDKIKQITNKYNSDFYLNKKNGDLIEDVNFFIKITKATNTNTEQVKIFIINVLKNCSHYSLQPTFPLVDILSIFPLVDIFFEKTNIYHEEIILELCHLLQRKYNNSAIMLDNMINHTSDDLATDKKNHLTMLKILRLVLGHTMGKTQINSDTIILLKETVSTSLKKDCPFPCDEENPIWTLNFYILLMMVQKGECYNLAIETINLFIKEYRMTMRIYGILKYFANDKYDELTRKQRNKVKDITKQVKEKYKEDWFYTSTQLEELTKTIDEKLNTFCIVM